MIALVTDIVLDETDRKIVQMTARILMALDTGSAREGAFKVMAQAYRDDVAEERLGSHPDALDELALGFSGALLFEMDRVIESRAEMRLGGDPQVRIVSPSGRRRMRHPR